MSNVSMPGVVGAAASGASITKPFIFIIMLCIKYIVNSASVY